MPVTYARSASAGLLVRGKGGLHGVADIIVVLQYDVQLGDLEYPPKRTLCSGQAQGMAQHSPPPVGNEDGAQRRRIQERHLRQVNDHVATPDKGAQSAFEHRRIG